MITVLWLILIYGVPALLVFHWGMDTLSRNYRDTDARLIAAEHLAFLLMLFSILAIQILPIADAPTIAIDGIGTLGVIVTSLAVHLHLRLLGWTTQWPKGLAIVVSYLWTIPGLWTLVTQRNLFNVSQFYRQGFWVKPYYNVSFHVAMVVAVVLTTVLSIGLANAARRSDTTAERGKMSGLFWGALMLTVADFVFGVLLPRTTPRWMPPYPYLVGLLFWLIAVRHTVTRFEFLPSRLHRYRVLFNLSPVPIVMVDATGRIADMNPAADALIGRKIQSWQEVLLAGSRPKPWLRQGPRSHRPPAAEEDLEIMAQDGAIRTVAVDAEPVRLADRDYTIFFLHDHTATKQVQDTLSQLAYRDALTGLPNSLAFRQRLDAVLGEGEGEGRLAHFALMVLDLDNFKEINDTLGHPAGNAALVAVAHRLSLLLREQDTVGRFGGDEFTLLLTSVHSAEDATVVGRRIIERFHDPLEVGHGGIFTVTVSLGISLYPEHGSDADTLIRAADAAMYVAKRAGKNQARIFEPSLPGSTGRHESYGNRWLAARKPGQ